MALNPPTSQGMPNVFPGEQFILRRPGMEFQAKDSFGRKFKGKGELHVSTIRMVFINHSGGDMQAFDLPMANITNEKFNQPIFGANNISGTVAAIANEQAGVTGQLEFKLWFNEGGCHTFLRVFFNAMEQLRAIPVATPVASEFTQAVAAGTFVQAAFVDPNDPSTVYVTQPVEQAEVPVAYPQNNLVATAVAVDPAAGGGAMPAVATVVDTSVEASQGGTTPPVAVATVVPSTGSQ